MFRNLNYNNIMWLNENRWKNSVLYVFYGTLITLVLIFVLAFVFYNIPKTGKFAVYPGRSPSGSEETSVILLDTETGDSWFYSDNIWKPIPKVKEMSEISSKLEDEIRTLKINQAEEIKALKAKREEEISTLKLKPEESAKVGLNGQIVYPKIRKYPSKKISRKATDSDIDLDIGTGEDATAPEWFR